MLNNPDMNLTNQRAREILEELVNLTKRSADERERPVGMLSGNLRRSVDVLALLAEYNAGPEGNGSLSDHSNQEEFLQVSSSLLEKSNVKSWLQLEQVKYWVTTMRGRNVLDVLWWRGRICLIFESLLPLFTIFIILIIISITVINIIIIFIITIISIFSYRYIVIHFPFCRLQQGENTSRVLVDVLDGYGIQVAKDLTTEANETSSLVVKSRNIVMRVGKVNSNNQVIGDKTTGPFSISVLFCLVLNIVIQAFWSRESVSYSETNWQESFDLIRD